MDKNISSCFSDATKTYTRRLKLRTLNVINHLENVTFSLWKIHQLWVRTKIHFLDWRRPSLISTSEGSGATWIPTSLFVQSFSLRKSTFSSSFYQQCLNTPPPHFTNRVSGREGITKTDIQSGRKTETKRRLWSSLLKPFSHNAH